MPPVSPSDITSGPEFASYLAGLRERAGLSFRHITDAAAELRANEGWVELPVATVSDFLHGKRLPTEAQLRSFLKVCRVPRAEAVQLLNVRQRLADKAAEHRVRRGPSKPSSTTTVSSGLGKPIGERLNPFALEVHEAITVPGTSGLPALPPYLKREHDHELRERIAWAVAEECSRMIVLVGGSSTGKTRACWEAIHAEVGGTRLLAGWRLWHPFDPTRPDAAFDALERVEPRTVVWLNETQLYLLTPGSDQGERVAARLRTLLADSARAPVLVLGTLWPEYWDTLTRRPGGGQLDSHAQARELLAGTHIPVEESFDQAIVDALKSSNSDPRLVKAAAEAQDGELTQYLAGAPALLERYETAPPAAKALLTAAMDLRRLGHGPAIPLDLLEAATPAYLIDRQWHSVRRDGEWFSSAMAYADQPCHGVHRPLMRIWSRPDEPDPGLAIYRLADYLDQVGRGRRRLEIIPTRLWHTLIMHIKDPTYAAEIGGAADHRLLYCYAIPLLRVAAAAGNYSAALRLTKLLADRGDVEGLRERAAAGSEDAAQRLAELLADRGDVEGLRERAAARDQAAVMALAELLVERGDRDGAEAVLRQGADAGGWAAGRRLAELLGDRGDVEGLRERADAGNDHAAAQLARLLGEQGDEVAVAALRARAERGDHRAASRLAELLADRGDVEGLRERADAGDWAAGRLLAELLAERGDVKGLRECAASRYWAAERLLVELLADRGDVEGLRECAAAGLMEASNRLAWLLAVRGDEVAVAELRARAATRDWDAIYRLDELLAKRGDDVAVAELRARADDGDPHAASGLVELLGRRRDVEGLRERADAGNWAAKDRLLEVFAARGDVESLRERADAGEYQAAHLLAELLVKRADMGGLRERGSRGDTAAVLTLAQHLLDCGNRDGAEAVLRQAADAGVRFAGSWLGTLLAERGDIAALRERADGGRLALVELLAARGDVESLRTEVLRGTGNASKKLIEVVSATSVDAGERLSRCGLNPDGSLPG